MPFSSNHGKAFIENLLQKIKKYDVSLLIKSSPYKILDVGVGSGTYSNLYRSLIPGQWTGVEIWEPYIEKYQLKEKYDVLIQDDIRKINNEYYDIVFLGDVVEHMTKEDAIQVVTKLVETCKYVFISLPIGFYPQGEYDSNPYEAHIKDNWSHEEAMEAFGKHVVVSTLDEEIGVYVLSKDKQSAFNVLSPKIAVYGIFKDEEKFIKRFLESCKDADEIVLCDTGSTDKTISIIEEFVNDFRLWNKITVEKITVLPWRFDDARNTALQFISPDIDICISLDSDEYLQKNWKEIIQKEYDPTVTRYYHRFCSFWNEQETNKSEHWHERIHVRRGYKWALPVHEILERYDGEEKIKWLTNFWMYQKPDMSKNRGSYLPLLEISTVERPDIWKSWSFLASEYFMQNRKTEALTALDKALALPDSDKSYIHNFKAKIFEELGRFNEAVNSLREAISANPNMREYAVYMAQAYERRFYQTGEQHLIQMAKLMISGAEKITTRTDGYSYNPDCWDESFEKIKNTIMRQS